MERYDEGAGQRAREVEVYVRSPVIRYVALLDYALLLQLLVGELVRTEDLLLLLLTGLALGLASHVVQVALVGFELAYEVRIVVSDRLVNLLEL